MLSEPMPPAPHLEDGLQNGVVLCKLGMKLLPLDPMWKKVYDLQETRYKVSVWACVYVLVSVCACVYWYVCVFVCVFVWVCAM